MDFTYSFQTSLGYFEHKNSLNGGPGRIRTYEDVSQQIYSLPQLTALVPTQKRLRLSRIPKLA